MPSTGSRSPYKATSRQCVKAGLKSSEIVSTHSIVLRKFGLPLITPQHQIFQGQIRLVTSFLSGFCVFHAIAGWWWLLFAFWLVVRLNEYVWLPRQVLFRRLPAAACGESLRKFLPTSSPASARGLFNVTFSKWERKTQMGWHCFRLPFETW